MICVATYPSSTYTFVADIFLRIAHFKSSWRCSLRLFLVGEGGEGVEDDGEDAEGCVVCPQLGNGGTLQIY